MVKSKRYLLKVPIVRELETQTFKVAPPREDPEKPGTERTTLALGRASSIIYFICFILIYFTAFANCDKTGPFKNWGTNSKGITGTAYNKCKGLIGMSGMDQSLTLSYMILYSNRYLSTILITAACILMAMTFIKQNFGVFEEQDGRIFCVIGPFILAFLLNSLLLFGPTEHSTFHFAAAGTIIAMGTFFCGISYGLYKRVYRNPTDEEVRILTNDEESTTSNIEYGNFEDLKVLTILISLSAVIAFAGAFFMYTLKVKKSVPGFKITQRFRNQVWLTDKILGTTEMANLILIGVYLLQISKKPPLLVNNFCAISV